MSSSTLTLKVFSHGQCIATHRMTRDMVKIGRLPTSHLRLEDDAIARMHAVLEVNGGEVRLVDLGSTTGTSVNGVPVQRSSLVKAGDRIELGPYTMFVELESPASTAVARAEAAPDPRIEHVDAPAVAQVITRWNDRVVDAQHIGAPTTRRRADASAYLALGGLLILGGATLFAEDVGQNWQAHAEARKAALEAGRAAPTAPGWGLGGLGIALVLAGLVPTAVGLTRRADRIREHYTLGESPDASFPAAGELVGDGLTLVRRDGDGVVLRVADNMRGHLELDGIRRELHELGTGTRDVVLQRGARAHVELGALVFDISAVAPGRVVAGRSHADKPFWLYNAAAFTMVGSLLALVHLIPEDMQELTIDEQLADNRFVGYLAQPDIAPEEEAEPTLDDPDDKPIALAGTPGKRAPSPEGKMGDPSSRAANRMYKVKGPRDAMPQIGRASGAEARHAGLLGLMGEDATHFLAQADGGAFTVGNADEDLWGNIHGLEYGDANGVAGLGLIGLERGGGGNADGIIGLGQVGTIGSRGSGGGPGLDYKNGRGTKFDGRKTRVPQARIAKETFSGNIDKEVIRRVVRAHINEVRGCYDQGLARKPNLTGRVAIQFTIGPGGNVPASAVAESSLDDGATEQCIARAVKRWRFPTGTTGGHAIVTYPFVLTAN